MNTIQELLDNDIDIHTAEMMLNEYNKHIGTMNGVYEITDVEYDFNIRGKIVTLECSECGKVIHRTMISGRNKWSELIKTCECQKEKKKRIEKEKAEKILQNKKAQILKDVESMIGSDYGVTAPTVAYRMKTYGLSFEEALKMPRITLGRPRKEVNNG